MKIEAHQIDSNHSIGTESSIENALQLNQELGEIVELELKSGNFIKCVSVGWPEKESVVVSFTKNISADHSISKNIKYTFLNDIRYWIHEYSTITKPTHLVIG